MPLLLLLQAAAEEASETASGAVEGVTSAVEQSTLLGLLLEAGPVGMVIFIILAVMSVLSWALAFSKSRVLNSARSRNEKFLKSFRRKNNLAEMSRISSEHKSTPVVTVFQYGYDEVAQQVNSYGNIKNSASVERALELGINEETSKLRENLGFLATTASASPFIGLFGTVWGVLDAFRGLGQAGGATLRAVAPGIAEALLATAFGLFAAIPALIFYNIYSGRLRTIRTRMEDFGLEFLNLAQRDYGA